MIHNVRNAGRRIAVRPSRTLQPHFVALGRRVVAWKQAAGYPDASGVTIGVTSLEDKSGRSVVAFNLAAALAGRRRGKVLLVETESRAAGFSRRIPRPGYGLAEMLQGSQSPGACVWATSEENLYVMSAGQVHQKNAGEMPVEALESVTSELCNNFQYIIFDLPLANHMTLCFPVLAYLDGAIIVNSPSIEENSMQRLVKRIREMNKSVIGLVLNKS
jgi:Mrp family chromosome partitioning ATPase